VVTDYTGDPSLSQARQAIGDAYVRNFDDGAKVQMGSFGDSASAEQMVRQLQQQGVPAQVYQP
jgi:acyl CoA:acetate/3-ketoacid CoA transferase alpha subunit